MPTAAQYLVTFVTFAALTGCYQGTPYDAFGDDAPEGAMTSGEPPPHDSDDPAPVPSGEEPGDGGSTGGEPSADGDGVDAGLPCEVEAVLEAYCLGCHGSPPTGAPLSLATIEDLLAESHVVGVSVAERAAARMADAASPMPPGAADAVPAQAQDTWAQWIADGMPSGSCGGPAPTDAESPFDVPAQCSSGEYWVDGNDPKEEMHPGLSCQNCHDTFPGLAPELVVGGTVYPTAHEPDDCYGAERESATVHITDPEGRRVSLPLEKYGNIVLDQADAPPGFGPPFSIEVQSAAGVRKMASLAPHGNCNACHTQYGENGAPGRILMP